MCIKADVFGAFQNAEHVFGTHVFIVHKCLVGNPNNSREKCGIFENFDIQIVANLCKHMWNFNFLPKLNKIYLIFEYEEFENLPHMK